MISLEAIAAAIVEAAGGGLQRGAQIVLKSAKKHAPVRQLFAGVKWDEVRLKTAAEIETNRVARQQVYGSIAKRMGIAYEPEEYGTATIATGKPPTHWHARRPGAALASLEYYENQELVEGETYGGHRLMDLHKRGAYEVRTMRALHKTWGQYQIGGKLRDEIRIESPVLEGGVWTAWVISPTRYGKYQEFGTRRNAAHPYLRPAADESREAVRDAILAAIQSAAKANTQQVTIEIEIRI